MMRKMAGFRQLAFLVQEDAMAKPSMAEVSNAGADWGQRQSPEGDRPTASCGTDLF